MIDFIRDECGVGPPKDEQQCPTCEAEWASVTVRTERGEIRVGQNCSRIFETFCWLMDLGVRRRPMLQAVR